MLRCHRGHLPHDGAIDCTHTSLELPAPVGRSRSWLGLSTSVVREDHKVVGAVGAVPVRHLAHVRQRRAHRVARCVARAQPQLPPEVCHLREASTHPTVGDAARNTASARAWQTLPDCRSHCVRLCHSLPQEFATYRRVWLQCRRSADLSRRRRWGQASLSPPFPGGAESPGSVPLPRWKERLSPHARPRTAAPHARGQHVLAQAPQWRTQKTTMHRREYTPGCVPRRPAVWLPVLCKGTKTDTAPVRCGTWAAHARPPRRSAAAARTS